MFVIFGTTTKKIQEETGYFICPQCSIKTIRFIKYAKLVYFIFIPLFAIGDKKNRHVECKECSTIFYPRVLENNRFNADGTLIEVEKKVAA